MSEPVRLIKKYPNRRLYDTQTSSYITLADVKELVLKHEQFQVVDAKSGEDLTRQILLQIILEEESAGSPMFSHDALTQLIRFYGNAMQGIMGNYLERNIQAFMEIQKNMQEQSRTLYGDSGKASQDMWSQFLTFQGPAPPRRAKAARAPARSPTSRSEPKRRGTRERDDGRPESRIRLARLPEGAGRLRADPHPAAGRGLRDLRRL